MKFYELSFLEGSKNNVTFQNIKIWIIKALCIHSDLVIMNQISRTLGKSKCSRSKGIVLNIFYTLGAPKCCRGKNGAGHNRGIPLELIPPFCSHHPEQLIRGEVTCIPAVRLTAKLSAPPPASPLCTIWTTLNQVIPQILHLS